MLLARVAVAPAHATTITDPANDFVASFTGTKSGNLDVLSFSASYDGTTFHLGATLNGPVNSPATSLYVIGFNRGAGTSNFAAIGLPNVTFDAVITLTGAGVTGGRDLVAGANITLPAGAATISGNSFTIDVPGALLQSLGFAPSNYLVNLWPRDGTASAGNGQIADFAPNSTDLPVPEPWSIAALASGLAAMALFSRRRPN